jgi:hypothetical protein
MQDYHAQVASKSRARGTTRARGATAGSTAGFALLLVALILSAGGVEIAQADPASKADLATVADLPLRAGEEPAGNGMLATTCEAGSAKVQPVVSVETPPNPASHTPRGAGYVASAKRSHVIPLNNRGYGYAPGLGAQDAGGH